MHGRDVVTGGEAGALDRAGETVPTMVTTPGLSSSGQDGASSIGAGTKIAGPKSAALSEVRFLTVAEVASIMRVSKMTVYRLVHSGEMSAVRVGRSFRVPEQAVHAYLRDAFTEAG
ncbi:MAG: hypothetical protein NVSMB13_11500 [Mycobacteriales bacterium]